MNKVICADSSEYLKEIQECSIDLIFTSPPYNFGMNYDIHNDQLDNYFDYLFPILDQCIRILKHGGRIAINIQPLFSENIPTHHIISNYLREKGLLWKAEIMWDKQNYNCNYSTWGSWKSPSAPYLKYTWEFVEVFCKGSLKKEGDKENADISTNHFKEWVNARWTIAPERKMKDFGHPAMFPKELAYRVLQLFSFKGDLILDPFCGTATTCVVAKETGRNYIGIDISEKYCEIAKDRLHFFL